MERILDDKLFGRTHKWLVLWKGYPPPPRGNDLADQGQPENAKEERRCWRNIRRLPSANVTAIKSDGGGQCLEGMI